LHHRGNNIGRIFSWNTKIKNNLQKEKNNKNMLKNIYKISYVAMVALLTMLFACFNSCSEYQIFIKIWLYLFVASAILVIFGIIVSMFKSDHFR
jgi:uncharacterized membrane protein